MNWRLGVLSFAFGAVYSAEPPRLLAQNSQPTPLSRDTLERWMARVSIREK